MKAIAVFQGKLPRDVPAGQSVFVREDLGAHSESGAGQTRVSRAPVRQPIEQRLHQLWRAFQPHECGPRIAH